MHWWRKWQATSGFLPGEFQGRGEPGGLPSMGSHRVGHDWSDSAAAAAACLGMFNCWDWSSRAKSLTLEGLPWNPSISQKCCQPVGCTSSLLQCSQVSLLHLYLPQTIEPGNVVTYHDFLRPFSLSLSFFFLPMNPLISPKDLGFWNTKAKKIVKSTCASCPSMYFL